MITLDERLAEARSALDKVAEPAAPPLSPATERQRSRRPIAVAAAGLAAAAAIVAVAVVVRDDHPRSITSVDVNTHPVPSSAGSTMSTVPASTSSTPSTAPTSSIDITTSIPAADGIADVVPLPLGDHGLLMIPGAWGTDAGITADSDGIHVTAEPWHASVMDVGQATGPDTSDTFDFEAPIDTSPRLGPLGPAVTITSDNGETVATTAIGGRVIEVRGLADNGSLINLLRSVTTPDRVRLIRPTSARVEVVDVVGLDYAVATGQLEQAGARVVWELDINADAPTGEVTSMSPQGGTTVAGGSEVVLRVAAGPVSRRMELDRFTPAGSPPDQPFGFNGSGFGFIDMMAGSPNPPDLARSTNNQALPVVFLRGELVGTFTTGGDGLHSASAALTDLVDPDWAPIVFVPQPDPVPVAITQVADHDGMHIGAPADWSITEGSCPQTKAVVIVADADTSCADAPGPWVLVEDVHPGLTPCSPVTSAQLDVCRLDSLDPLTSSEILLDTRVVVTYRSTLGGDGAAIDAIRRSITGGRVATGRWIDFNNPALDSVKALLRGDCDFLSTVVAPGSTLTTGCSTAAPETVDADELGVEAVVPIVDPEDLTHAGAHVFRNGSDGSSGWYVELQANYSSVTLDYSYLIIDLTDEAGRPIISRKHVPAD